MLTNLTFKSYWGRPRPVVVTEFNGPWEFVPWWDPRGECGRNCSFFSGEGATAFWTYAPAALTPPAWRPLAYVAATLFGVVTSVLRMAFGGHFFTDVAAAGLVSFLRDLALPMPGSTAGRRPGGRMRRSRPRWRGGAGPATGCCGAGAGARWGNPIPANAACAIKRVPISAKFDIRAPQAANDIRHFDRLEAP